MPRPSQPRFIGAETVLAHRIAELREAREWTYEGLAARVTAAGCPIQASTIYKIEKVEPRRRITVDEFYAFARAFGMSPSEVLASDDFKEQERLDSVIRRARDVWSTYEPIWGQWLAVREEMAWLIAGSDELTDRYRKHLDDLHTRGGQGVNPGAVASGQFMFGDVMRRVREIREENARGDEA